MRIGRIKVSEELVRRWLQFPDATILEVNFDVPHRTLDIVLEDREMPIVREGDVIPDVMPLFTTYEDYEGHRVAVRQTLNG